MCQKCENCECKVDGMPSNNVPSSSAPSSSAPSNSVLSNMPNGMVRLDLYPDQAMWWAEFLSSLVNDDKVQGKNGVMVRTMADNLYTLTYVALLTPSIRDEVLAQVDTEFLKLRDKHLN